MLAAMWNASSPARLWTTPFARPVPHEANSAFGTRSILNGKRRLLCGQLRSVQVVLLILIYQREKRSILHGQHEQGAMMIHGQPSNHPVAANPSSASDDRGQLHRHRPVLASILPLATASVSAL